MFLILMLRLLYFWVSSFSVHSEEQPPFSQTPCAVSFIVLGESLRRQLQEQAFRGHFRLIAKSVKGPRRG